MSSFHSTIYCGDCPFPNAYSWYLCQKRVHCRLIELFMCSLLCFIALCMFLCQYHALLVTIALKYNFKSGIVVPLVLFFSLRMALAFLGLLWFHINVRIIFSTCKEYYWYFDRDCIESVHSLGSIVILTVLIPLIREHGISFHFWYRLQFLSSVFYNVSCIDLSLLWLN